MKSDRPDWSHLRGEFHSWSSSSSSFYPATTAKTRLCHLPIGGCASGTKRGAGTHVVVPGRPAGVQLGVDEPLLASHLVIFGLFFFGQRVPLRRGNVGVSGTGGRGGSGGSVIAAVQWPQAITDLYCSSLPNSIGLWKSGFFWANLNSKFYNIFFKLKTVWLHWRHTNKCKCDKIIKLNSRFCNWMSSKRLPVLSWTEPCALK